MKVQTVTNIRRRSQLLAEAPAIIYATGGTQVTFTVKHVEDGKSVQVTISRAEFNALSQAFTEAELLTAVMGIPSTPNTSGSLV